MFSKMEDHKEETGPKENSKSLWASPWKYKESIVIVLMVILGGVVLEILSRKHHVKPLHMPYNVFIGAAYISFILFFFIRYRKTPLIEWCTSAYAAISAISLFSLMVLLLGVIPQDVPNSSVIVTIAGLNHVKVSWLFLVTHLFFLTILFMVIVRRLFPVNIRNIAFLLNHGGVFLIISGALVGSGDIKHLNINLLKEDSESNIGISDQGNVEKLPFSLQLLDFYMEEYPPRLGILDHHTHRPIENPVKSSPLVFKGMSVNLSGWKIQVINYLPKAVYVDSTVLSSDEIGNSHAALVLATNVRNRKSVNGWVMAGSFSQKALYLQLDTNAVLTMLKPEPKKYRSTIVIRTDSTKTDTAALEVNKPYALNNWKIYQVGYDQSKGKWSSLAIIEAVHDPWLRVVYAGFIMMLAGILTLFWIVRKRH